jgi:hypothetical protein
MKILTNLLIPVVLFAMSGCVVAPVAHRGYYGPGYYHARVAVVAPAPVVIVRP